MPQDKSPLQVYLDQKQLGTLRYLAKKRDTSMAEIIRESVAKYLSELPVEEDPAMGIVAMGRSGCSDIAENHDAYLVEEYEKKTDVTPVRINEPVKTKGDKRRQDKKGGSKDGK